MRTLGTYALRSEPEPVLLCELESECVCEELHDDSRDAAKHIPQHDESKVTGESLVP